MQNWIDDYFKKLCHLQLTTAVTDGIGETLSLEKGFTTYIQWVKEATSQKQKIIFIGNGGSAGIASHVAIDYSKNGGMPSMAFNDPSALTCLSNDYGYEHVFAKQLEFHAKANDVLVAISSSGRSVNILNAVNTARDIGCKTVTFSGFKKENPLSQIGDLNFYVASNEYGFVEVAHLGLIHALLDRMLDEKHASKTDQLAAVE